MIAPNDRLPQLVAEMVQKGLNSIPKAVKNLNAANATVAVTTTTTTANQNAATVAPPPQVTALPIEQQKMSSCLHAQKPVEVVEVTPAPPPEGDAVLQYVEDPLQINQIIPLQNMESIKFQVQPQLTQVVVAAPQLDVSEQLFMCQPTLMFEPGELISMTTIPPHFVQVHPSNVHNQQGHFL